MNAPVSQDTELFAWAAAKLQEAQRGKIHGTVTFHIEAGTIVRVATNAIEKPGGHRKSDRENRHD
jgi:hypothetical protein